MLSHNWARDYHLMFIVPLLDAKGKSRKKGHSIYGVAFYFYWNRL